MRRVVGDGTGLTFATVTTDEGFAALGGEGWDDLVAAMPRPSPFLLHGWLRAWWRHEGEHAELAVHVARRDGRLVGVLPCCIRRAHGLRVLGFLGGVHSALGDVLVAPGEGDGVAEELARFAAQGPHDLGDFFGLPQQSRLGRALGSRLHTIERVEAPVLELGAGWDAVYRAKTDSKKRNLHKRRRRQLSELGELEVVRARTADELDAALDEAFRLHELRWSGRPDGSGFVTATGRRFNRDALHAVAADDRARIVLLRLDGRAIAFHYYLVYANRMYVYRLAFDPALGRYSPGLVNTLDALEWAAEEGVERVEYLGGGERYKLELADRLEPLHEGVGLARTPQGAGAVALYLATIRTRRRLKRSPTLHRLYFETLAPVRRAAARVGADRSGRT